MFPLLCSVLSTQTRLKMSQYLHKTFLLCPDISSKRCCIVATNTRGNIPKSSSKMSGVVTANTRGNVLTSCKKYHKHSWKSYINYAYYIIFKCGNVPKSRQKFSVLLLQTWLQNVLKIFSKYRAVSHL